MKIFASLLFILFFSLGAFAQQPENWTSKQLIEPSELAGIIRSGKDLPVIFSVGPGAPVPHSVAIGMARDEENLGKLKKELSALPRDTRIVVYCGCCPFGRCPNVRPAIALLNDMKFTHFQLLDLPHNIKADWNDKGFPVNQ